MTHPPRVVAEALSLVAEGLNDCEISRRLGINRVSIREWRTIGPPVRQHRRSQESCPICGCSGLDPSWYAYLLGLYLGDGCLTAMPRCVYKLRITLDAKYPLIIRECKEAIRAVRADPDARVGTVKRIGCFEICHHWKHWICLFPQHGPGRKHLRRIELARWQELIVQDHPARFITGLIHSDGCRDRNVVLGKSYPRYSFSNNSEQIKTLFCEACDRLGINWTRPSWKVVAISRRADVAKLDAFIGPKR